MHAIVTERLTMNLILDHLYNTNLILNTHTLDKIIRLSGKMMPKNTEDFVATASSFLDEMTKIDSNWRFRRTS